MKIKTRPLVFSAMIAAMYIALTLANIGYSYGGVQFRVSEALTVLPFLFPETIFGLFVGCLISNMFSPIGLPDVVIGSLATLAAAFLTSKCRTKWLAPVPPIVINAIFIGMLVTLFYTPGTEAGGVAFAVTALQVGAGQIAVCFGLGMPLLLLLEKTRIKARLRL